MPRTAMATVKSMLITVIITIMNVIPTLGKGMWPTSTWILVLVSERYQQHEINNYDDSCFTGDQKGLKLRVTRTGVADLHCIDIVDDKRQNILTAIQMIPSISFFLLDIGHFVSSYRYCKNTDDSHHSHQEIVEIWQSTRHWKQLRVKS